MGGCKCTFRNCPNTTANSPGLHFFHYPLKDHERYYKWAEYANNKEILNLPPSKARNKVVCETHFRGDCFMNYKRERLVHYAVPTIIQLEGGLCLDYEESEFPTPKPLEPPKGSHLIPPSKVTEQGKVEPAKSKYTRKYTELIMDDSLDNNSLEKICQADYVADLQPSIKIRKVAKPKILNACYSPKALSKNNSSKSRSFSDSINYDIRMNSDDSNNCEIFREDEEVGSLPNEIQITELEIEKVNVKEENISQSIKKKSYVVDGKSKKKQEKVSTKFTNVIKSEMMPGEVAQESFVKEDNKNVENLKDKKQAQVEAVSTSRQLSPLNTSTFSKAQLFNNIKKYLSPSMATLVRMEMFGGPDREWKVDEKQLSVELLRLGHNLFKYFRDEWRFRLPPLRSVEMWLEELETLEPDEDL